MFKPGRFNGILVSLSLAVCFFLGAFQEFEAVAQPCNGIGQSVPGEVQYPEGWSPEIAQPQGLDPTENCLAVGTYQYTATGGTSPYTWSLAAGTAHAEIDSSTGVLTIDGEACGTITVNVTDKNGHTGTIGTCITQNSKWIFHNYEECCGYNDYLLETRCKTGEFMYTACKNYPYNENEEQRRVCPCGGSGGFECPCPGGCSTPGCPECIVGKIYTYKRVCNN